MEVIKSIFSIGVLAPFVIFLLVYYFTSFILLGKGSTKRRPPGPGFALPLIGHLHLLGRRPHLTFLKWKKQYGTFYMIKMANKDTYVVNDAKLMKEMLTTSASAGRPKNVFFECISNQNHGIVFSDGKIAEEQRAFAVKTLADLGLSRSGRLEGIILDEAKFLIQYFERKAAGGVPFRANRTFNGAVVSSLWSIVAGEKVEWIVDGDVRETEITKFAGGFMQAVNNGVKVGMAVITWLRFLPGLSSTWANFTSTVSTFYGMVDRVVEAHVDTLNSLAPRDFIDHYLIRLNATSNPASGFYKETGRINLKTTVSDVLFTGSETTATALEYVFMYVGCHPQVQNKLHKELDRVLGQRWPTLSDRNSLPYTEAVILETIRRSAIAASSVHRITEDIHFQGYLIPKNSHLFTDFYSIIRDQGVWGDTVDDFVPERFLNGDETEVVLPKGFIPFSVGRRMCLGEPLARDTLFLFLTCIFQKFSVEVKGNVDFDEVESGFTIEPPEFEISVRRRNK